MTRVLLLAKSALAASIAISLAVIGGVHYEQYVDRLRMHDGIIRDVERQQKRKLENTYRLQEQREFTKILKRREEDDATVPE